jgi:pimeloyl-ACP methyl ester carboxylesterase
MAQTIETWEHRVPALSKNRGDALLVEPVGLGREIDDPSLLLRNVALPRQAERLMGTIDAALGGPDVIDLAGFSLGGRIAMAFVCLFPEKMRKLHLADISLRRSSEGLRELRAWEDHLSRGDLRAFAEAALRASCGESFLRRREARLPAWIRRVVDGHSTEGLLALMQQTHVEDGEWSVAGMAERLTVRGRLFVGMEDRMAPPEFVPELVSRLNWDPPDIASDTGHAAPVQQPRAWQKSLLEHLDE